MKTNLAKIAAFGLTAGALLLSACGDRTRNVTLPEAPDAAIQTVVREFSQGNGGILWQAMPASYQNDVNELVQLAGSKLDAEVYNKGFALIGRFAEVAEKQKNFVLNSAMAQSDAEQRAKIEEAYPSIIGFFNTLAESEIATLDGVKSFNGAAFFENTVSKIADHGREISKLSDDSTEALNKYQNATVKAIEVSDTEATLEMTVPGEMSQTEKFTKVESRWVPAEMARDWATETEKVRTQLNAITPQKIAQNKPQVLGAYAMIEGVLAQIEAAETQEQFDQAVQGAMMPFMGLMMMGQGFGNSQPNSTPAPTPNGTNR